jgi:release factor glutamine methyltransferase
LTIRSLEDYLTAYLLAVYEEPEATAIAGQVSEHLLGLDRLGRSKQRDQAVAPGLLEKARHLLDRLLQHEPVQYVLGRAHFYGFDLYVTPAVLIPRPETEELVDLIIKENRLRQELQVLDIGTGSGCIPLALATHLPAARVYGLDVSAKALAVARQNATNHQVTVEWLQADILQEATGLPVNSLDIIVSNPPYVLEGEKKWMRQNVLAHEPHLALFVPNADPLLFYRCIATEAKRLLRPYGLLYFEINEQHGKELAHCLEMQGYQEVRVLPDLFGKDRFVRATNHAA